MSSYKEALGLTNRANSALLKIERILERRDIPSATRLALVAQTMKSEPILTDDGPGAVVACREARKLSATI